MSRLIDADLLRAEFTGNFNEMWHYTGIWAMIDCAPTAYDIDKVIEEIKALIEFEFDWLRAVKHEEGRITLAVLDVAERAIKSKATEIVKKGGAE